MSIVTICASTSFYPQTIDVETGLKELGYTVIIPAIAAKMKQSGDFDASHYKIWFTDANDYEKRAVLMREHFDEVTKGDATLVLNYEKHGVENYIGGNVLMEMAIAFYFKKPIFILNEIPKESAFLEEILGLGSIALHGEVENLLQEYKIIS